MPIASTDGLGLSRSSSTSCRCFRRAYPYRLALAENVDELLPALQGVAPWLRRSDLNAVLGTCMDLDRGVPDVQGAVVSNARIRFSRQPTRGHNRSGPTTCCDLLVVPRPVARFRLRSQYRLVGQYGTRGDMVVHESRPFNAESGLAALTEVLTPTDAFYVRGHSEVPEVDPDAWRLADSRCG